MQLDLQVQHLRLYPDHLFFQPQHMEYMFLASFLRVYLLSYLPLVQPKISLIDEECRPLQSHRLRTSTYFCPHISNQSGLHQNSYQHQVFPLDSLY